MSQRLNEYFAGEAADYLQQLAGLIDAPVPPDPIRLLRLATGVRGSTQMAGADDLADLASHLENALRGTLQGSVDWSSDLQDLSRRTVSEMQALVYSIDRWGEEEASRIRAVTHLWTARGDSAASAELDVVPIETLFFDDEGPHIVSPEAADERRARVPVGELLYRGPAALRAARELRPALERIASGEAHADGRDLRELVEELFDLLDLSMEAEASEV